MDKDEALHLALEALEYEAQKGNDNAYQSEREAIKAALEAKDEPVAWISPTELLVMRGNALGGAKDWRLNVGLKPQDGDVGLYTTPPQRIWVGLTDEEITELHHEIKVQLMGTYKTEDIYRAIEAKLRSKNYD